MATESRRSRKVFKIEMTGDETCKSGIMGSFHKIKSIMGYGTTNTSALQLVFSYWLEKHQGPTECSTSDQAATDTAQITTYQRISFDQAKDEKLYICGESALSDLMTLSNSHGRCCNGKLQFDTACNNRKQSGFWYRLDISCSQKAACKKNALSNLTWCTSSYLPNGQSHINAKMTHGYTSSGLLPSQFRSLMQACGIESATRFAQNCRNQTYVTTIEEVCFVYILLLV